MQRFSESPKSTNALQQLRQLQQLFADGLSQLDNKQTFVNKNWLRDAGVHGGGQRLQAEHSSFYNRAQINVSQVHFENELSRPFTCATALSTIIHPNHPLLPSIHMHISLTELRNGQARWRIMADLNPSHVDMNDQQEFDQLLKEISGEYFQIGCQEGDKYFYIPALKKSRGVSHFYIEAYDDNKGAHFPIDFGKQIIAFYLQLLAKKVVKLTEPTAEQKQQQLNYFTLYFYQVLTLDKGTTAGILAHDQNDVGTLGSLPAFINRQLLAEWIHKTPQQTQKLIENIVNLLPEQEIAEINNEIKQSIANLLRQHYNVESTSSSD